MAYVHIAHDCKTGRNVILANNATLAGHIILDPGAFYILVSREAVHIPPDYAAEMAPFKQVGFDDIIVLAPVPSVIADAATFLAPQGVMNVFAGVARGTMVKLDLSDAYLKGTRVIGHSASSIDDLWLMLHQAETGVLSPNRSVAAVGSLDAAKEGLQAVQDTVYPGKIVIYPNIKDFPLTAVPDLKDKLPSVYAKLKDGREWTIYWLALALAREMPERIAAVIMLDPSESFVRMDGGIIRKGFWNFVFFPSRRKYSRFFDWMGVGYRSPA